MEDRYSQMWVYERKLDGIVQRTMIVLLVLALLALAFAPKEHAGMFAQRKLQTPTGVIVDLATEWKVAAKPCSD